MHVPAQRWFSWDTRDLFFMIQNYCAIPRDKENSFKLLRIEMENYSLHDDDGNVLNRTSMDIALFNINLLDEI